MEQIESGEAEGVDVQTYTTTDTHYTFTGLDATLPYSYRVNATTGTASSQWTAWTPVTLTSDPVNPADVNRDGHVDSHDVLLVYEYIQQHGSGEAARAEDVNADGQVDAQDVLCIYAVMRDN